MRPSIFKDYLPVGQEDGVEDSEKLERAPSPSRWRAWTRWVPWILMSCLVISNWILLAKLRSQREYNEIFSPASKVIKYKPVVFHAGIDSDRSPYQGPPTPESDHLWEELHKYGVSRIPLSDAAQLNDRTAPIPDEEGGGYPVILDVFHQLHCLNHVRNRLWYNGTDDLNLSPTMNMKHLDHCIESLRESLMCAGDTTPIPFQMWSQYGEILPTPAVTHTCRDFDAILEWAKPRRAPTYDKKLKVPDPLGEPVVYDLHQ